MWSPHLHNHVIMQCDLPSSPQLTIGPLKLKTFDFWVGYSCQPGPWSILGFWTQSFELGSTICVTKKYNMYYFSYVSANHINNSLFHVYSKSGVIVLSALLQVPYPLSHSGQKFEKMTASSVTFSSAGLLQCGFHYFQFSLYTSYTIDSANRMRVLDEGWSYRITVKQSIPLAICTFGHILSQFWIYSA